VIVILFLVLRASIQVQVQLQLKCNWLSRSATSCTYLHLLAPGCATCTKKYFAGKIKKAAASTLTLLLRFSPSRVGRRVPPEPLLSEPNLNDFPSLRFIWALTIDHGG